MPVTKSLKQHTISKDSIAGYDQRESVMSAYEAIGETNVHIKQLTQTPWKKVFDYIPRFIKATRLWVMGEQITAMAGRSELENDTDVATLAFNTAHYVNLTGEFNSGGGLYYPIYSEHFKHNSTESVFYAPMAGDYLVHMYFYGETTDAEREDYIEIFTSWREGTGVSWAAPEVLAGAANMSNNLTRVVSLNGSTLIRMRRGNELKFGLQQIGRSGTWASFTRAEMRVLITKVKFYPQLKS